MNNNENMRFWEKLREVPADAKKTIESGRLAGLTDINPMWRIKALTETFGPVGNGWKYEIVSKEFHTVGQQTACFVDINLFYRSNGEWSAPIPGTGGSMLTGMGANGAFVNDDCFKMALTDAISVAAKALGMAADVYWQDKSKYEFGGLFAGILPPQAPPQQAPIGTPSSGQPVKLNIKQPQPQVQPQPAKAAAKTAPAKTAAKPAPAKAESTAEMPTLDEALAHECSFGDMRGKPYGSFVRKEDPSSFSLCEWVIKNEGKRKNIDGYSVKVCRVLLQWRDGLVR